jgi:hypothetical protein
MNEILGYKITDNGRCLRIVKKESSEMFTAEVFSHPEGIWVAAVHFYSNRERISSGIIPSLMEDAAVTEEATQMAFSLMDKEGGSFARSVARSYEIADKDNRKRIERAFEELIREYCSKLKPEDCPWVPQEAIDFLERKNAVKKLLTNDEKIVLLQEVSDVLYANTEFWQETELGANIAYLFSAIAFQGNPDKGCYEQEQQDRMIRILKEHGKPQYEKLLDLGVIVSGNEEDDES